MPRRKKRKWTRRNGERAIDIIQRVRSRNNRLWMQVMKVALKAKPRETRKLISQITKNDQEISSWTSRI